jgi:hypothetical protein
MTAGSIDGFTLYQRGQKIVTFPTLNLQVNDFVIVHLGTGNAACKPSGVDNETTAKDQAPKSAFSTNFDSAYDVYATSTDEIFEGTNVITLLDTTDKIVDAVLVAGTPCNPDPLSVFSTKDFAATSVWRVFNQPGPTNGVYSGLAFCNNSVVGLSSTSTSITGNSLQRNGADSDNATNWTTINASSWGAINVGQP